MKKMIMAACCAAAISAASADDLDLPSPDVVSLLQAKYRRDVSNEAGRVFWHGKKIGTVTDPSNNVTITTFSDGKRFFDPAKVTTPKMSVEAANRNHPRTVNKKGVPQALAEARERRAREKANGTVEVSVEVKAGSNL